eukprot:509477-Amorphochlora_amoeboformis.AAC.1
MSNEYRMSKSSKGSDPQDDDDDSANNSKIKRRLARKAELARASRRRKKAYVQDLELKVAQLNAKLMELQAQEPMASDHSAVALALSAMSEMDTSKTSRSSKAPPKVKEEVIEDSKSMDTNIKEDVDTVLALSQAASDPSSELVYCIKANFNGDIRRFSLVPSNFNFEGLKEMLGGLYKLEPDTFTVSYFDEDNDAITISTTEELREAQRLAGRMSVQRRSVIRAPARAVPSLKLFITVIGRKKDSGDTPGTRRRRNVVNGCKGNHIDKKSRRGVNGHVSTYSPKPLRFENFSFVHMQEVKLGLPCTVSRLWIPVHPTDTLGRLMEQFKRMTRPRSGRGSPSSAREMLSVNLSGPTVQRLSYRAKLLDLKSTVQECGIDDKSTLHVVQVENAEMVPRGSKDSFRVYVNCEENGYVV